jgi:purine-nucleoside phosphorylase
MERMNTLGGRRLFPGHPEASKAADYLRQRIAVQPRVGIILGSGLGAVAARVRGATSVPYRDIPYFPASTVPGHAGELQAGSWAKVPVVILLGRVHLYEGYSPAEIVFPTRVLALLGIKVLVITCAAGGITAQAVPGSFMVFSDHINALGSNPLAGPSDPAWGERFLDMSEPYDPELRALARRAASRLRIRCSQGVYVAVPGPSYETPAEIRALKTWGADAVGMSTVPEVLAARQLGLRLLAIASITNRAAGIGRRALSHHEVLAVGKRASLDLAKLLEELLKTCG